MTSILPLRSQRGKPSVFKETQSCPSIPVPLMGSCAVAELPLAQAEMGSLALLEGGRSSGPRQQREHLDWFMSVFIHHSHACPLTGSQKLAGYFRMLGATPILVQKAQATCSGSVPSCAFWQLCVLTRECRSQYSPRAGFPAGHVPFLNRCKNYNFTHPGFRILEKHILTSAV